MMGSPPSFVMMGTLLLSALSLTYTQFTKSFSRTRSTYSSNSTTVLPIWILPLKSNRAVVLGSLPIKGGKWSIKKSMTLSPFLWLGTHSDIPGWPRADTQCLIHRKSEGS